MSTTIPLKSPVSRSSPLACALILTAFLASALIGARFLVAQTPSAHPAPGATHAVHHKRPHVAAAQPAAAPAPPATPPIPRWPVNVHPVQASVTWDSRGLSIDAANSSLQQILRDVMTATGLKVEGMGADERVFGVYGPGEARDVLSQLLNGSGYNMIMIGDQGQGTPRQIVLSARHNGNSPATAIQSAQNNADEDAADNEVDEQPQPQPAPAPIRPGFGTGEPARTPQQIMQEMQQRQQQMPPTSTPPPQ
jgi:hypothetical protein